MMWHIFPLRPKQVPDPKATLGMNEWVLSIKGDEWTIQEMEETQWQTKHIADSRCYKCCERMLGWSGSHGCLHIDLQGWLHWSCWLGESPTCSRYYFCTLLIICRSAKWMVARMSLVQIHQDVPRFGLWQTVK
jgi:hypothetical protein